MSALRLTVTGICYEIREWIDAGRPLICIITTNDAAHVGEPAYELYPIIEGVNMFVKVGIVRRGGDAELLLIVSAHHDGGGEGS